MEKELKLMPVAIGSLPHNSLKDAMDVVKKDFSQIPFPPQLANLNKNEDMIIQYLQGFPGFNKNSGIIETESETYWTQLEEFYTDYENIISDINSPSLDKYAITAEYSSTFPEFINIIKNNSCHYAKAQITGAFTMSTSLNTSDGKAVVFDENLRDVVVKLLTLKALWQIKQIKTANKHITPIIFMDEPSVSQIGTSAYLTITEYDVISMIEEISDNIKAQGALSAIHCCGKCDWHIPIKSEVDIINFDAYSYFENFKIYHNEIKKYLGNRGKVAWGMIPTFDEELLNNLSIQILADKFNDYVKKLTKYGIDEKLILDNSLITSTCGAGAMSVKGAERAMDMVKELSNKLKERYQD